MSSIEEEGYEVCAGVITSPEISDLLANLPELDSIAGTRNLLNLPWCRSLAFDPRIQVLVHAAIGLSARPVRGILFDKSPNANWNLGWHQDKKIAVKNRIDVPGFFAWSEKEGVVHCQAPREVLDACVAVRLHLDECGEDNGPLRVVPGSHRSGVQPAVDPDLLSRAVTCSVRAGDVILMKPLLWHSSSKALSPNHRRVIHIEYCAIDLPDGLEWAFD